MNQEKGTANKQDIQRKKTMVNEEIRGDHPIPIKAVIKSEAGQHSASDKATNRTERKDS